ILSILLKSYWNVWSWECWKNPKGLSILLKSYWNLKGVVWKAKARFLLSILLKSYWNWNEEPTLKPLPPEFSFNSSKVLLEQNGELRVWKPNPPFNSSKVLLERSKDTRAISSIELSILLKSYWNSCRRAFRTKMFYDFQFF
ncbi:MAG: hypothetical protein PWQ92_1453, partial [Thermococcaceae archaeon]|nr:hypothetical protein [Thermococcaceae archaeon]